MAPTQQRMRPPYVLLAREIESGLDVAGCLQQGPVFAKMDDVMASAPRDARSTEPRPLHFRRTQMNRSVVVVLLAGLTASCATGYHPKGFSGGYEEKELGEQRFEVAFFGNGITSKHVVLEYWQRRAGELCANGYTVIRQDPGSSNVTAPSGAISVAHPWMKGEIQCK